ncbi:ABC transporter permease [Streptomyces sp. NPDC047000]|uniref:ABC transporter permease n=1 Tax=Streptomyces sp. NPDC047000 TaxID=3155474 RepID=UPI0033E3B43E
MFPLALRTAAHRITALLAVLCAVLGGAALITGTGVLAESGLRSTLPPGRLGGADVVVTARQEYRPGPEPALALPERARVPARLAGRLARLPGVTAAVADIGFPAALTGTGGRIVPTADDPVSAGHGWSSTHLLDRPRITGRAPDGAAEIAVPAVSGLRTGDTVRAVANGRPAARYRVTAVVDAPDAGVYFADATAVRLAGRGAGDAASADLIGLTTRPGTDRWVARAVRRQLAGTGLEVRTGADIGEAVSPGTGAARSLLVLLAGSLGGIVLLITGFVTAGALSVSVAGQRRDLALMRAVGATPRQIRRLAAAQSSAVAAVAVVPGTALGYLLAGRFRALLADRGVLPSGLPLTYGPLPAVATLVLIAAVVQVAARSAAWRTSRMPATEAVAESRSEPRRPSTGRALTGFLLIAAASALSVTPLLSRTVIGASATSIAGIVAAIGLALCGPLLVQVAGRGIARRLRAQVTAPTWLAVANVRAYALRVAGVVGPLAMAVVFVLTYTLAQTTLLAATGQDRRDGTLAQYRIGALALGGLPADTRAAVRRLPGVRAAVPVGSTTVVWSYRQFGDTETESAAALVAPPAVADVLDLGVRRGTLARLTGATVAVSSDAAASRGAGPGARIGLLLGDGTRVRAKVVAVYDRGLGFGPLVLSGDLVAGHTTSGLAPGLFVRTDGTAAAAHGLTRFTADRPGLVLEDTGARSGPGRDPGIPPEMWINLVTIAVLLAYLLLSIVNKLVAATAQRRTEIAALRLAGTTPRQIRAMTRREAALTAAAALVSGLLLSALPLALLGQGFLGRPWPAGPLWLLPAVLVTVVAASFLAVEFPTRTLLRTAPAEALRAAV